MTTRPRRHQPEASLGDQLRGALYVAAGLWLLTLLTPLNHADAAIPVTLVALLVGTAAGRLVLPRLPRVWAWRALVLPALLIAWLIAWAIWSTAANPDAPQTAWTLLTIPLALLWGAGMPPDRLLDEISVERRGARRPWLRRRRARTAETEPAGSILLGHTDSGPLRAPPYRSALVVGQPGSGKTRHVLLPNIAAWPGPVVATSTKLDLELAIASRAEVGPVVVWDPSDSLSINDVLGVGWSPLLRAGTWDGAVGMADAIVRSRTTTGGSGEAGQHFGSEAAGILAPLLLAAHHGHAGLRGLRGWLASGNLTEPQEILRTHDTLAADELAHLGAALDQAGGRYAQSVLGTSRVATDFTRRRAVLDQANPVTTPQLDLERLILQNGTLLIVSPSEVSHELAPLIVAMIQAVYDTTLAIGRRSADRRPPQPVLAALDEAANIAPLPNLGRMLSEGPQLGFVSLVALQTMAQAQGTWGREGADALWGAAEAKLVLAGTTDPTTTRLVVDAAGDHVVRRSSVSSTEGDSRKRRRSLESRREDSTSDSYTEGWSEQREARRQAADLASAPKGTGIAILAGRGDVDVALHHDPRWFQASADPDAVADALTDGREALGTFTVPSPKVADGPAPVAALPTDHGSRSPLDELPPPTSSSELSKTITD